jgi:hypothetical protein
LGVFFDSFGCGMCVVILPVKSKIYPKKVGKIIV